MIYSDNNLNNQSRITTSTPINYSDYQIVDFATYDPREFRQQRRLVTQYNKQVNKQYKPIYKAEGINKGYSGLKLMGYVRNQVKNGDPMSLEIYEEVKDLPKSKANAIIRMKAEEMINKGSMDSFRIAKMKSFLSKPYGR